MADETIEEALKRGEELFSRQQIDEAEAVFQSILQQEPGHSEALNNMGVICFARGDGQKAEELFSRALDGNGDHLESLSNLADLYRSMDRNDKELACLEKIVALRPDDRDAANRLVLLYVDRINGDKPEQTPPPPPQTPRDRSPDSGTEPTVTQDELGPDSARDSAIHTSAERTGHLDRDMTATHGANDDGAWKTSGPIPHDDQKIITPCRKDLITILNRVCYAPHGDVRKGELHLDSDVFSNPDREVNLYISPGARIDLTGDVTIGPWCMIGSGTVILTHDHFHDGRDTPLLSFQERWGVKWRDKVIGNDVWLHGCTVLAQVSHIPDGVVVGTGSVLTRNPGPYEIWAGNPAVKVGERK